MAHSSIGNMTGTLIETGARHMSQCRTNYDVLVALADGEDKLLQNDDQWCMAKDELVVSCGKNIVDNTTILSCKYAYPSVITTLGDMDSKQKTLLAAFYHFMGTDDVKDYMDITYKDTAVSGKELVYRNFIPVGYSVGRACAHAFKGDTMASVQIGGLRTVLNGAFEVQTGDVLMMYIPDAEESLFNEHGGRMHMENVDAIQTCVDNKGRQYLDATGVQRKNFYNRGLGMKASGNGRVKTGMFSIKPFAESQNEDGRQYYGDRIRVFARALSCARAFEPLDIMIARQSL
jgi:hypothetical protein